MLLRYFVNFYDMEIIEEEAFLSWKEDITQEYPGKGKALFQVIFCVNIPVLILFGIRLGTKVCVNVLDAKGFFKI